MDVLNLSPSISNAPWPYGAKENTVPAEPSLARTTPTIKSVSVRLACQILERDERIILARLMPASLAPRSAFS